MSEIFFPKLKLKRKRSCVAPEPHTTGTRARTVSARAPALSEGPRAHTGPAPASAPAAASTCPGADALWALTLGWVLQELQDPSGQVPELPPLSAMLKSKPCPATAHWGLTHEEEEEVAPFPEFTSSAWSCPETDPSTETVLTPRSPHSSDVGTPLHQTETWAPEHGLPMEGTKETREGPGRTERMKGIKETPEGPGGTKGMKESRETSGGPGRTEGTKETRGRPEGPGGTKGTKESRETSGGPGRTEGTKETRGTPEGPGGTKGTKESRETSGRTLWTQGTAGTEAAEELLLSCPMCLLLFPPGISQLQRDGHLAQCLSDVNIDVTW